MKKLFFIFLLNLPIIQIYAQNLVPNPSFEIFSLCPDSEDQIERADGWSKYSGSITTPDYFNSCATGQFSVPNSIFCYQNGHTGSAYAGLITFGPQAMTYREQIGIQLSQPLVIGTKYFISFFTSMCEKQALFTPSNNIGIRLSTLPFNPLSPSPIDNFAHLFSSSTINDSINWVHISGSIIADSTYEYLILGNFFDNLNTDTIQFIPNVSVYSYYIVDDVCLSIDSLICNTISNVNFNSKSQIFHVYPNPTFDYLSISYSNLDIDRVEVHDVLGHKISKCWTISENEFIFDFRTFESGNYFIQIFYNDKFFYTTKFFKL